MLLFPCTFLSLRVLPIRVDSLYLRVESVVSERVLSVPASVPPDASKIRARRRQERHDNHLHLICCSSVPPSTAITAHNGIIFLQTPFKIPLEVFFNWKRESLPFTARTPQITP